jgi:hypothetical protein
LGRAFPAVWRIDKRIKNEISLLPYDFSFMLKVLPSGPSVCIFKDSKGRIKYGGFKRKHASVVIQFKNTETAFSVLSFQLGALKCYAQNGMTAAGDLISTMAAIRCLNIVEAYMLPSLITKSILKRDPAFSFGQRALGRIYVYVCALAGI